jgi:heat shock protein HslJ
MRSVLEAAIDGDEIAEVVSIRSAPSRRRPVLWWAAGAVAAAAAAVALVLVTTDDGAQHITPATVDTVDESNDSVAPTEPSTVTSTATPTVTLGQLAGHRWIVTDTVTDNVAVPWPRAVLPFVEFGAGNTLVSGTDGCNDYSGTGSLEAGSLRIPETGSTAVLCDGIPDGALHDGDHLVLSPDDGLTLQVMSATGDPRLRLVQADGLAPATDLDGRFAVNTDSILTIDFVQGDFPVVVGECLAAWNFTNGQLVRDDASLQVQQQGGCLPDASTFGRDDQLLLEELTNDATIPVVHSNTSDDVFLLGNGSPIRLSQAEPAISPDHITLDRASVLGLTTGDNFDPESTLQLLQPVLGPVDHDTGWYTTPVVTYPDGTGDCLGGIDFRVLWWGDLSIAFWRQAGEPQLWAWSVGDRQASAWDDRREPYAPTNPTATGIATVEGIHVGSTEAEMLAAYADRFHAQDQALPDGTRLYLSIGDPTAFLGHRGIGVSVTTRDGVVTGIGSARQFC